MERAGRALRAFFATKTAPHRVVTGWGWEGRLFLLGALVLRLFAMEIPTGEGAGAYYWVARGTCIPGGGWVGGRATACEACGASPKTQRNEGPFSLGGCNTATGGKARACLGSTVIDRHAVVSLGLQNKSRWFTTPSSAFLVVQRSAVSSYPPFPFGSRETKGHGFCAFVLRARGGEIGRRHSKGAKKQEELRGIAEGVWGAM